MSAVALPASPEWADPPRKSGSAHAQRDSSRVRSNEVSQRTANRPRATELRLRSA